MINNKKVVAIVQARMESTRLPGKVLMPLANYPALGWLLKRVNYSHYVDRIILALPDSILDLDLYLNTIFTVKRCLLD